MSGEETTAAVESVVDTVDKLRQERDSLAKRVGELEELVDALSGRDVEFAVTKRVEAISDRLRAGDASDTVRNLVAAFATVAALALANGRWAALENRRGERQAQKRELAEQYLRGLIQAVDRVLGPADSWVTIPDLSEEALFDLGERADTARAELNL